jgi:hypothetical protein
MEVSAMERTSTWDLTYTQLDEYNEEIIYYWNYRCSKWAYAVTVREFFSEWGSAKHLCIAKELVSGEYREPTMLEKREIISGVCSNENMDETVAFEIFPAKSKIVDKFDVYHLWLVKKNAIPFSIDVKPAKHFRNWKVKTVNGKRIIYTERNHYIWKPIKAYFLKAEDGSELRWYDKQNFKDEMIGEDVIAFEFVTDKYPGYTVLICVPKAYGEIPFGLR